MKSYPDWRFNFSDDWQEKKLSENFVVRMCKRIYKEEATEFGEIPFYKIGTLGKKADSYISKQLYETYRKKYHFPDVEDTLISCSGTVGNCVIYDGKPAYFQDSNIVWLESNTDTKFDKKFLYLYLSQLNWNELSSTTIKRIYSDDLLQKILSYPCIEEQKKISDYLTHFDKALTAQEKKVTNWREVKKGMLQKIFSCEFRFKDDKGNDYPDWQEKIFEEEFIFLTSNTLSRNDLNYCGGEIKNIHYGDILTKFNDVLDVSSKEIPFINFEVSLKNKIYLQDGDVIFSDTAEDYTSGKVIEIQNVKNSLLVSGLHTISCRPNKQYSKGFLGYYLNSNHYRKQILPLISGIKVMSISKSNLQKTFLKIPCLEEQKKIADYFSHLDKIISAESKILESMREMKKGLLQKLFV